MTEAGLLNPNEADVLSSIHTEFNKYFVPLAWTTSLLGRCRKEGRIKDDTAVQSLVDEVNQFRGQLGSLFNYDWISIPLVYTQVVTIAVYSFFLSNLMGRQLLTNGEKPDVFVPVFTLLQFFFYMGWLKVAETLVNPFGEDDDDFDINQLIDRNLRVVYIIVDEMHSEHPQLIKDQYWDEVEFELPYTKEAARYKEEIHVGTAMNIPLPEENDFLPPAPPEESIKEVSDSKQRPSKPEPEAPKKPSVDASKVIKKKSGSPHVEIIRSTRSRSLSNQSSTFRSALQANMPPSPTSTNPPQSSDDLLNSGIAVSVLSISEEELHQIDARKNEGKPFIEK